jgi:maltose/moltooligosaccharide transporter
MADAGRPQLAVVGGARLAQDARETTRLIWILGLGAFGLAWAKTTIGTYLPAVLGQFTDSATIVGVILSAEGWFAITLPLLVGPLSDATRTPFGRRRPYMAFALGPLALSVAMVAFMPNLVATAFVVFAFFFAYYIYEPPYRGLYPDLLPDEVFGRSQGVQHVLRGIALGVSLVAGGFLLDAWEPFPFVLAAGVGVLACALVVALVRESTAGRRHYEKFRSHLAAPWRIVKRERNVQLFLLANTAWEATFAGMYTFVVLYVTKGLDQPLYVSSLVLAVVAGGYIVAAAVAGRLGDHFGIGRVIIAASVLYGGGLTAVVVVQTWHVWYYALLFPIAIGGGAVMTLAWGLLFKVMPPDDRGAVAGLAIMTKGIALLGGPLGVGVLIDIFRPQLQSTDGYAAMWPAVGIPILLAIPLVVVLSRAEDAGSKRTETPPVA